MRIRRAAPAQINCPGGPVSRLALFTFTCCFRGVPKNNHCGYYTKMHNAQGHAWPRKISCKVQYGSSAGAWPKKIPSKVRSPFVGFPKLLRPEMLRVFFLSRLLLLRGGVVPRPRVSRLLATRRDIRKRFFALSPTVLVKYVLVPPVASIFIRYFAVGIWGVVRRERFDFPRHSKVSCGDQPGGADTSADVMPEVDVDDIRWMPPKVHLTHTHTRTPGRGKLR